MPTVHANAFGLSTAIILQALLTSGLTWHMHLAQLFALDSQSYSQNMLVTISTAVDAVDAVDVPKVPVTHSLFGVPIILDGSMPLDVIELRQADGSVVSRIEQLAVPSIFAETV